MHKKTVMQRYVEMDVMNTSQYRLAKEFIEMNERAFKGSLVTKYEGYSFSHSDKNKRGGTSAVYFTIYFKTKGKTSSKFSRNYKCADKKIFQSVHSFEEVMTSYQLEKIKKST